MATLAELLAEGTTALRGTVTETPRLDAELLLGHVLDLDRTQVVAHGEAPVGETAAEAFRGLVARRAAGEPVAYIRGLKEFHGLAFSVDPRALIPRPETERLVDLAVEEIVDRLTAAPRPPGSPPLRVVDVGTGSGAVAVAVAVELRRRRMLDEVTILATDVSADALGVAAENVVSHVLADAVRLLVADLLPPDDVAYDIVAANLPYVRSDAMAGLPRPTSYEPASALDGGPEGLDAIRGLLERLRRHLASDGVALLEIGADQEDGIADAVASLLPGWRCTVERDLAGLPRVARIQRPA
ncbi:MAG TPA: peptide chain release factor N(5)-glutamine methyltransferase [Candidatus Limnocylindrales bacterium]|nr:peptide chain release factor N(5)-glutamine methyltransferase [Candidatus Limnocylindrales bacterium]